MPSGAAFVVDQAPVSVLSGGCEMPEPERKKAVHNAGAFMTPGGDVGGMIPIPMRTLSDDYHDEPTEPEDSDRVPATEPPGLLRRLVDRFRPNRDR